MIREKQEEIMNKIMDIGTKIHSLVNNENQDDVYALIADLGDLQDKVVNM